MNYIQRVNNLEGGILDNTLIYFEFNSKKKSIIIRDENFSSSKKCHTRRYYEALEIMENKNTTQLEISKALDFYFYQDKMVPQFEKFSIEEIYYCPKSRIIQLRMINGTYTYKNRIKLARATGWYFYVTGTQIPQSKISLYVDRCKHRYNKEELKWDFNNNASLTILPITCYPNENSYLLQLGNINILLDAGLTKNSIQLIKENGDLDAIFISHTHYDHIRGLSDLIKEFPNVPIILSATSLDFILLQQQYHDNNLDINQIINNSIVVKNNEKINFNRNGYLQFFFAGHMPGALMLFLEFDKYRFLFTGDYSFHSYQPIPGINIIIDNIPSPIDFLLVDGAFSDTHYNSPKYQFDFLRTNITFKAKHKNNVLIGADPASTAIIIYLTLHNHFISLKEKGFESRPTFFLNNMVRDCVQILCSRLDDIHPKTAKNINSQFNPFSSALIQWIQNSKNKFFLEKGLKDMYRKNGNVVIFNPADLRGRWIEDFFKIIASDRFNAIYLAGALRNPNAIELVSGRDELNFQSQGKVEKFSNKARILNRDKPDNILNLHGDNYQLGKIIEILKPNQICFFQQDPKKLIGVRNWIVKEYPFVANTYAFYPESHNKIIIQGSVKS